MLQFFSDFGINLACKKGAVCSGSAFSKTDLQFWYLKHLGERAIEQIYLLTLKLSSSPELLSEWTWHFDPCWPDFHVCSSWSQTPEGNILQLRVPYKLLLPEQQSCLLWFDSYRFFWVCLWLLDLEFLTHSWYLFFICSTVITLFSFNILCHFMRFW